VNSRVAGTVNGFLIALMFALALWAIDALPAGARVAIHWGLDGQPNRWMGKWPGLLFIPVLAVFLAWLASAFPQGLASPGKRALAADGRRALFCCVIVTQAVAQAVIALVALGRW